MVAAPISGQLEKGVLTPAAVFERRHQSGWFGRRPPALDPQRERTARSIGGYLLPTGRAEFCVKPKSVNFETKSYGLSCFNKTT